MRASNRRSSTRDDEMPSSSSSSHTSSGGSTRSTTPPSSSSSSSTLGTDTGDAPYVSVGVVPAASGAAVAPPSSLASTASASSLSSLSGASSDSRFSDSMIEAAYPTPTPAAIAAAVAAAAAAASRFGESDMTMSTSATMATQQYSSSAVIEFNGGATSATLASLNGSSGSGGGGGGGSSGGVILATTGVGSPRSVGTRSQSSSFSSMNPYTRSIVKLNIGGKIFMTTSDTLTRGGLDENYFSALLSGKIPTLKDDHGCYFIDRDGQLFVPILNYLRTGKWLCAPKYDEKQVLEEARFYCIEPAIYSTITDAFLTEAVVASQRLATQKLYQQHRSSFDGLQAWFLPEFLRQANEGKPMPHVYLFDSEPAIIAALPQRTSEISRIEEIAVQQGTIDYIRTCLRKNPQYRFSSDWKRLLSDSVTRDAFIAELRCSQSVSVAVNNNVYLGAVREQEPLRAAEPELLPGCQDCVNHGALTPEYSSTWCIGVCSWPANKTPEQLYGTLFWKKNGLVIYWDAAKNSFPRDYIAQECGKFKRGKYNHAHPITSSV